MHCKIIFFLSTFCISFVVNAQNLYFKKSTFKDSIEMDEAIRNLALKTITYYKESDKNTYLNNLYKYQIAAKQYDQAIVTLKKFQLVNYPYDTLFGKGVGFAQLCLATLKSKYANQRLKDKSKIVITELYNSLHARSQLTASGYFTGDVNEYKNDFYSVLDNISEDSIDLATARSLCKYYCNYVTYSNLFYIGKEAINEIDNDNYTIDENTIITTRDKAKLNIIIARKKKLEIKQPAIIIFNIYNDDFDKVLAKISAANEYIGVIVNLRGKNKSTDSIIPFEKDGEDIYDVIDWISKQAWCNGKVGMYGASYQGFSQWSHAKKPHPALKTFVPIVSACPGIEFIMTNNVFYTSNLQWIHKVTNNRNTDDDDFNNFDHWQSTYSKWYKDGLKFEQLDSIEGRPNRYFQHYLKHPNYDKYWESMIPNKVQFTNLEIPILSISGYYDGSLNGAMHYYNEHIKNNKKNNHYLLLGPYTHQGAQSIPSSNILGFKIDSCALMNMGSVIFDWFDYVLKDKPKPKIIADRVNVQVSGTNKWRHEPSIEKLNNDTLTFFFGSKFDKNSYLLLKDKEEKNDCIFQRFDLKDRSDSIGADWHFVDTLPDITNSVMLKTESLTDELVLNGAIHGNLSVMINKKDFDLRIRLYEQMPNGKYLYLNDESIFRASYIKNRKIRQLLNPNKLEKLPFNTGVFTSRKFSKGSKIVILLGISKSVNHQINYGTGKDVSEESIKDAGEPLQIKWYNDSYIQIPVWRDKK